MDSTSSLQEIISSFHIYFRSQRWGFVLVVSWHFILKSCLPTPFTEYSLTIHIPLFCLHRTLCIILSLLFLTRYVNIVYLLDPQPSACTPIKLDPLISLPDACDSCDALALLTVSHSHRCSEMWMQYSVCVDTEVCFACVFRKWLCGALGLRLSPKWNIYTYSARNLPKKSSVLQGD
jgi:hypothetical protein